MEEVFQKERSTACQLAGLRGYRPFQGKNCILTQACLQSPTAKLHNGSNPSW